MSDVWWKQWDPNQVILGIPHEEEEEEEEEEEHDHDHEHEEEGPDEAWKVCVLQGVYFGENEYNGSLGGRISAIFVILATSLIATLFPVVARRVKWMRIPEVVYTIAKMFGSGVIVATAFIHLLEPGYSAIGSNSCVGMTGDWAEYPWAAAIMLSSAVGVFLVDAYCDYFADIWYGVHDHMDQIPGVHDGHPDASHGHGHSHAGIHDHTQLRDDSESQVSGTSLSSTDKQVKEDTKSVDSAQHDYHGQFAGFLILEFGVLFHSVMIGLTLGSSEEYGTLYPVLVFHQAFEGLGIGARMSMIPFPNNRTWVPYVCSFAYALTTPIAIAIGIGVRTTYRDSSYTALVVQGCLDCISAGILLYTGFVELLARDFMFNPVRTKNVWMLTLQLFVFLWGAGLMALLGKWA